MIATTPHPPPAKARPGHELHEQLTREPRGRVLESSAVGAAPQIVVSESGAVPLIVVSSARDPADAINGMLRRAGEPVYSPRKQEQKDCHRSFRSITSTVKSLTHLNVRGRSYCMAHPAPERRIPPDVSRFGG